MPYPSLGSVWPPRDEVGRQQVGYISRALRKFRHSGYGAATPATGPPAKQPVQRLCRNCCGIGPRCGTTSTRILTRSTTRSWPGRADLPLMWPSVPTQNLRPCRRTRGRRLTTNDHPRLLPAQCSGALVHRYRALVLEGPPQAVGSDDGPAVGGSGGSAEAADDITHCLAGDGCRRPRRDSAQCRRHGSEPGRAA